MQYLTREEPGIDLELVQIKSPYPRITGNHYGDYACSAVSFCKVVPEEPQMPAPAKAGVPSPASQVRD